MWCGDSGHLSPEFTCPISFCTFLRKLVSIVGKLDLKKQINTTLPSRIIHHRLFLPIACLLAVLLSNLIKSPSFFTVSINNGVLYGSIVDVINRSSELIILAIGMTFVTAASGGQDVSVGAVMSVSAAVCCQLLTGGETSASEYQVPLLLAMLAGIIAAMLCGAFNGFLVSRIKIQPMVATLILYTAGRGIAQLITQGQNTYVNVDSYLILGGYIPGIPVPTPIFVAIAVLIIIALVLKFTALGIYTKSAGANNSASRLVGLNAKKVKLVAYIICAFMAGLAGLVASSRIHSADANNIGLNLEMDAILAVALGGNMLSGGRFSLVGSVIGAVTIQTLTTTLYTMNVSANQLPVYKAVVISVIVLLQSKVFRCYMIRMKNKFFSVKKTNKVGRRYGHYVFSEETKAK